MMGSPRREEQVCKTDFDLWNTAKIESSKMENIYYAVKVVSLLWIGMVFFIYILGENRSAKEDGFSKYIVMMTLFGFMPGIQYVINLGRAGVGNFPRGFPTISYLGFFLIFLGLVVNWTGILTLKKQWSSVVIIKDDHQLVDHGIYKFIRHPIYSAVLLVLIGFCLALANWISFLVILLPNMISFGYRIHVEERALERHFGEEYINYEQRTKRLIPWIF
jgi:protein-S-isoprenylcysteine O-methyltransferase Ste14